MGNHGVSCGFAFVSSLNGLIQLRMMSADQMRSLAGLDNLSTGRLLGAFVVGVFIALLLYFGAGEVLSHPAPRAIGAPPPDFPAQTVRLSGPSMGTVVGWFSPGQPGQGAVLLFHGVRADRTQMLARARFLHRSGYATLLIDLPAHGESAGSRITFGGREAEGVTASLAFVRRELPGERVAVIGVSLGAASTVLAHFAQPPDAVILESMYPTIEEALTNRLTMRLGPMGALFAPALLWQLPLRTGVKVQDLQPIRSLPHLGAPVFIASGAEDQQTPWAETQRLFEAAKEPKEMWQVEGAGHVDLHAFSSEEYERRILNFLEKYVRREGPLPKSKHG